MMLSVLLLIGYSASKMIVGSVLKVWYFYRAVGQLRYFSASQRHILEERKESRTRGAVPRIPGTIIYCIILLSVALPLSTYGFHCMAQDGCLSPSHQFGFFLEKKKVMKYMCQWHLLKLNTTSLYITLPKTYSYEYTYLQGRLGNVDFITNRHVPCKGRMGDGHWEMISNDCHSIRDLRLSLLSQRKYTKSNHWSDRLVYFDNLCRSKGGITIPGSWAQP